MPLCLRVSFLFLLALSSKANASGLVIVNEQVPAAMGLAEQYRELHGLNDLRVLALDIPPSEGCAMELVKSQILPPVRDAVRSAPTDWILCTYGMPVWVQDGQRKRSLDQLLALCLEDPPTGEQLILSPLYYRDAPSDRVVIPVSRLDAPTLGQTRMILESWARLKNWGGFRRAFPYDEDSSIAGLLSSAGHLVHGQEHLSAVDLQQVQWLEALDQDLDHRLARLDKNAQFAPGAVIIRYHNDPWEDLPLRSRKGSVARALGKHCSFYIGALAPGSSEEDLFDAIAFARSYLSGDTFIDSVYRAIPTLGGSLLICGDPMAKPYHSSMERIYETSFSESIGAETDPSFVSELQKSRQWWLMRDYQKKWEEGNFAMVQNLLGVAKKTHGTALFREMLCWTHYRLGEGKKLDDVWNSWPEEQKGRWERHLRATLWGGSK